MISAAAKRAIPKVALASTVINTLPKNDANPTKLPKNAAVPCTVASVDIAIQATKPLTTLVSKIVAKPPAANTTICTFSDSVFITLARLFVTPYARFTRSTISVNALLNSTRAWPSVTSMPATASRVSPNRFCRIGRIFSAVSPPSWLNLRSSPTVIFKPSASMLVRTTLFSLTLLNSSPLRAPLAIPWANWRAELAASDAVVPDIKNVFVMTSVTSARSFCVVPRCFDETANR